MAGDAGGGGRRQGRKAPHEPGAQGAEGDPSEAYIGTRPSKASVQSICCRISERTDQRWKQKASDRPVGMLNRMISGWARYFWLGQVSPAYAAADIDATKRLQQWLCRKHNIRSGKYVRFSSERLWDHHGLIRLAPTTKGLPWTKA